MSSFEHWLSRLITSQEEKILHQRYQIIQLLKTKLTYREIARNMGISTTTVVRLNKRLNIRKSKSNNSTRRIYSFDSTIAGKNEYINKKQKTKIPWIIG